MTSGRGIALPRIGLVLLGGLIAAAMLVFTPAARAVTIGTPMNLAPASAEGCEVVVLPPLRQTIGVPPSCTFFAPNTQTPPGNHVVTTARIRTGPRTGPMRFVAVQAMRSKASVDGRPAGIICCVGAAQSQVFTPQPNSVNQIPVQLPMRNTTEVIDGEQIEVIDYLGISLLDLNSSVPLAPSQSPLTSFMTPALQAGGQLLMNGLGGAAIPTINGEFQACAGAAAVGRRAAKSRATTSAGCAGGGGRSGGGGNGNRSALAVSRRVQSFARGTRVRTAVRIPAAGILRVTAPRNASGLVRPLRMRVQPGTRRVVAVLSRRGRAALIRRSRLRIPLLFTFRSNRGAISRARTVATFRRR